MSRKYTDYDASPEIRRELRAAQDQVAVFRSKLTQVERITADRDAELEALRRAHEVLSRRLVAERAAFADGIARIQANLYGSRSWRYTAPLRAAIRWLGRLKP